MPLKLLFLIFLGFLTSGMGKPLAINHTVFDDVYKWKYIEYQFDSESRKEKVMSSSDYNKANMLIFDFDVAKDGRTFVTVNKREGIPASLNTVSKENKGKGGPLLKPYPNWKWHSRKDCIGIYRVLKVQIDECNRLWVLDNGISDENKLMCPAQLLMFDLSSDELKSRLSIPKEFFRDRDGNGHLSNIIVQTEGSSCQNTKVYMSYLVGSGLVIWNGENLWRLNGPDPSNLEGSIHNGDKSLNIYPGIFGFALSPKIGKEPQIIAMRAATTLDMYTVKIDDILATSPANSTKNIKSFDFSSLFNIIESNPSQVHDNATIKYKRYKDVLPSQSAGQIFNADGILFMGLSEAHSIACWDKARNLTTDNVDIVDKDKNKLEFISSLRILDKSRTGREEELWILTIPYIEFVQNSLDLSQFNYRIMKQETKRLLTNSKCIVSK